MTASMLVLLVPVAMLAVAAVIALLMMAALTLWDWLRPASEANY
ncbi:hypothetical protein [Variovorax paradoxus]|nr:hypothetical protein [Variovorax paradoxus]WPH18245.1 hypothetical protein RZE78_14505 [Variovorax paradoxus]